MNRLIIAVCILAMACNCVLGQRVINVDITSSISSGPTGYDLPGVIGNGSSAIWNPITDTTPSVNLLDQDGQQTTVGFQLTGTLGPKTTTGIGDVAAPGIFAIDFGGGDSDFFRDYAYVHGGGDPGTQDLSTFTISGLGSGTSISEVILYATWTYIEAGTEFRLSSDGGATFTNWLLSDNANSVSNAPFSEGNSYVRFTNLTSHTDGTILGEWRSTLAGASIRHRGPFNGFQISADVDPLALRIDVLPNGLMKLYNPTTLTIDLDYLEISSEDVEQNGGSLDPVGFSGLGGDPAYPAGNNDGSGWELADNNNALLLIESYLAQGGSSIAPGESVILGAGYVPGETQDLSFKYHALGLNSLSNGSVEFIAGTGLSGDFDSNGVVDGGDFLLWQRYPNIGNLNDWKTNFGATSGGPSLAIAIPEPVGLATCLVGIVLSLGARTRR